MGYESSFEETDGGLSSRLRGSGFIHPASHPATPASPPTRWCACPTFLLLIIEQETGRIGHRLYVPIIRYYVTVKSATPPAYPSVINCSVMFPLRRASPGICLRYNQIPNRTLTKLLSLYDCFLPFSTSYPLLLP